MLQSGNYLSKLTSLYFVTYITISVLVKLSNIARRLLRPARHAAACLVDPAGARVAAYVLQSGNYPSKLSSLYFVTYITISVLVMLSNISSNSSS